MNKAHYIIFHPDYARQQVKVKATALVNNQLVKNCQGNIWVDQIGVGNEDPFVFGESWLYSYCHATQLKKEDCDTYLQKGSTLIFVSGQQADQNLLTVDTLFLIGDVHLWTKKPNLQLPKKFQSIFQNNKSDLWRRHFRFPFHGTHDSVSHTYEAELWQEGKSEFSYLPLNEIGERVSIPFNILSLALLEKIKGKVKGKYPVMLTDKDMLEITNQIKIYSSIKVLKNISNNLKIVSKNGAC